MLFSSFQKPKQKRHRCRNPNKLDINTLTGEERVPVVNKRNGKKVNVGRGLVPSVISYPRKKCFSLRSFYYKKKITFLSEYMCMVCVCICGERERREGRGKDLRFPCLSPDGRSDGTSHEGSAQVAGRKS